MGTRDERVDDLFFQAVSGEPTEEGQTRRVSTDIRTFIGGLSRSLLTPRAWKEPVVVATTGPITLSGLQTIDGIALSSGDRVLVKDQSTGSENGIRVAAAGAWQRSNDFDLTDDLITGMIISAQRGTANGGKMFRLSTTGTMTLDTTALTFDVFPPAGGGTGDVVGPASATDGAIALFDTGTGKLLKNSTLMANGLAKRTVGIVLSGSPLTTGVKGAGVRVPFSGTITKWTVLADAVGSIVVDVWKAPYASYPPTVANTIAGTEKPTLSSQRFNEDATLTTWSTAVTAGDVIMFSVDSVSGVTKVTIEIEISIT